MKKNERQEQMTHAVIHNLSAILRAIISASSHPTAFYEKLGTSLLFFSGSAYPLFNSVLNNVEFSSCPSEDNFAYLNDFFSKQKLPFMWWWFQNENIPTHIKHALLTHDFQYQGTFEGIACSVSQLQFAQPSPLLKIIKVINQDEYAKFIDLLMEVFQISKTLKNDFHSLFSDFSKNQLNHYLGFHEDKPVSCATTFIEDGVVGIYNCATMSQFQKRGFCRSVTEFAIQDSITTGTNTVIAQLLDSGMAKGFLSNIGLKQYCSLHPYLKN